MMRAADCVAATVKWQMHPERQMQMDGARQKRKHAE